MKKFESVFVAKTVETSFGEQDFIRGILKSCEKGFSLVNFHAFPFDERGDGRQVVKLYALLQKEVAEQEAPAEVKLTAIRAITTGKAEANTKLMGILRILDSPPESAPVIAGQFSD